MSVNKLSELAGMSHVGIIQIESGNRSPQLRTVLKLANALALDLADVIRAVGSRSS
jgi:transcriptional regulator with XRE-family HTH domain